MLFWVTFVLLTVIVIPVCIFFGSLFFQELKTKYFVKNGVPGIAKIISVNNLKDYNGLVEVKIVLEIKNSLSFDNQATVYHFFETSQIPKVGDDLYILIDPKKPNNVILSPSHYDKIPAK